MFVGVLVIKHMKGSDRNYRKKADLQLKIEKLNTNTVTSDNYTIMTILNTTTTKTTNITRIVHTEDKQEHEEGHRTADKIATTMMTTKTTNTDDQSFLVGVVH